MSESNRLFALDSLARVPGLSAALLSERLAELAAGGVDWSNTDSAKLASALGLSDIQARVLAGNLDRDRVMFDRLFDEGVRAWCVADADYPGGLRIRAKLPWITGLGNTELLHLPSISFSGQRDAHPESLDITRRIAEAAVEREWSVVSGGARGIDWQGHLAALECGGSTIVILAQGIGTWQMSAELADWLDSGRLLVISQFLPFDVWSGPNAMQRNRTIAQLGQILFVPQVGLNGGAYNTASYALKHDVLLRVADTSISGNQAMIAAGAQPILWLGSSPDFDAMLQAPVSVVPRQSSLF